MEVECLSIKKHFASIVFKKDKKFLNVLGSFLYFINNRLNALSSNLWFSLLEQMFFYRALTAPAEELYLSALSDTAGGVLCGALNNVLEALAPASRRSGPRSVFPTGRWGSGGCARAPGSRSG